MTDASGLIRMLMITSAAIMVITGGFIAGLVSFKRRALQEEARKPVFWPVAASLGCSIALLLCGTGWYKTPAGLPFLADLFLGAVLLLFVFQVGGFIATALFYLFLNKGRGDR